MRGLGQSGVAYVAHHFRVFLIWVLCAMERVLVQSLRQNFVFVVPSL